MDTFGLIEYQHQYQELLDDDIRWLITKVCVDIHMIPWCYRSREAGGTKVPPVYRPGLHKAHLSYWCHSLHRMLAMLQWTHNAMLMVFTLPGIKEIPQNETIPCTYVFFRLCTDKELSDDPHPYPLHQTVAHSSSTCVQHAEAQLIHGALHLRHMVKWRCKCSWSDEAHSYTVHQVLLLSTSKHWAINV